jgi:hypothetical protein
MHELLVQSFLNILFSQADAEVMLAKERGSLLLNMKEIKTLC